jgi:DNA-directed RNA polymerase subunit E"
MADKKKTCLNCKKIFEGSVCPACGDTRSHEGYKGKVDIVNPEKSQIAQKLKIKKEGEYAIKVK